ncbi:hypothetical protein SAMN05421741_11937 [Paenimyroides ummariense]|uniref:Alpha/beta hydrolase n=1 Tax=Paenimyroides ummariense TaxID=913024 RepID=A0A1I5E9Z4_9FLAO|nr:hypothetical protein [Paenimyroides ummariense]SFO07901.1 hypothetical protein SAMN05421741_11937 [Paenimyroides ummariense]
MQKAIKLMLFLFLINTITINAQTLINNEVLLFSIENKTIDFIVADKNLEEKKPILLFCQGSLPIPLLIKKEDGTTEIIAGGVKTLNLEELQKSFYVVVVSMPETPATVSESDLNNQFYFDPRHENQPTELFLKADYVENYVNRAEKVLSFLQNQSWVSNEKLVIAGHSQGTKIASKIALQNKFVTHLGLFNPNPFGRIDEEVRQARLDAQSKKISWTEASTAIDESILFYQHASDPKNQTEDPSLIAWKSFSQPSLNDWLKIEIPIYIAYGTEDTSSALCDIVPLFFISQQKQI